MKLLNKIENKRGDALILTTLIVVIFLMFTVFIVDFGFGYSNKVQLQSIADAASISGANWAKEAYYSVADNRKISAVDPIKANAKATEIVNANSTYLMDRSSITGKAYNPSGKVIDGRSMNSRDQYYSGNFTVRLSGEYESILLQKNLFNNGTQIPYLQYQAESRVHVTPQ